MNNFETFKIFAQNKNCGYMLEPPGQGDFNINTHNLCFEAKIRKIVYPCVLQFYYIKVGYKGATLHGRVLILECIYLFIR